jgi:hypothetical protein
MRFLICVFCILSGPGLPFLTLRDSARARQNASRNHKKQRPQAVQKQVQQLLFSNRRCPHHRAEHAQTV